ncbi:DUF1996 domain-containing protein [Streptomyces albipurpureus]|uniref:DUF1996 domain-containing protein n=1 Tax=Streptomyces albipurpureus TaxID=2897419 RepID=A0ABT0UR10_9ACTN|nr:DUF1996 domain-containing protein [Streptomyces sp. CWNU-1]MCM2391048.1 DUF1996 domain-containing protein [Streptomyces sp. CWNU-1]
MGRTTRRRSKLANRAIISTVALILGGGGLVAVNVTASAGEGRSDQGQPRNLNAGQQVSTIDCPEVANGLPREMPGQARAEVDRELAAMDTQITDAYQRFAERRDQVQRDPQLADKEILSPLQDDRQQSIDRIVTAIDRSGARPQGMESMASCTLRADDSGDDGDNDDDDSDENNNPVKGKGKGNGNNGNGNGPGSGNGNGNGNGQGSGQGGNGPVRSDFVDIKSIRPNVQKAQQRQGASRGTFTSSCGVNANGLFNSDNVIVAPGVSNGAHHMHDYIGNQANNAFASNDSLARGRTTCSNRGDKSTYYWPVLRVQNGRDETDANAPGGGEDQNVGEIQTPTQVSLTFVGSPVGKVTAMPRFLRIITGDAKAFANGPGNANASWSCTGFEERQLKDKYPICPRGSQVVRTFKFQSCWDGRNTDSANHRTHVAFADRNGRCGKGFRAIPQLVQRVVYKVPPGPGFAVDSFPEQLHKPVTDHGDFINVFDRQVMNRMVSCINSGDRCR